MSELTTLANLIATVTKDLLTTRAASPIRRDIAAIVDALSHGLAAAILAARQPSEIERLATAPEGTRVRFKDDGEEGTLEGFTSAVVVGHEQVGGMLGKVQRYAGKVQRYAEPGDLELVDEAAPRP